MKSPLELGRQLVEEGCSEGLTLRLFGGCAIELQCRNVWATHPELQRIPGDVDLACYAAEEGLLRNLFKRLQAIEAPEFNALNSGRRLAFRFDDVVVDVIEDVFEMSHKWPLRARLALDPWTLSFEDLLLTKLQVAHPAPKDVKDSISLLLSRAEHASAEVVRSSNLDSWAYMCKLCGSRWGLWRTVGDNLKRVREASAGLQMGHNEHELLLDTVGGLLHAIDQSRKGLRWQVRSLIGERLRWYEIPEVPVLQFADGGGQHGV